MTESTIAAASPDRVITVPDVALVFEGGGMRASVSAPVVQLLLREGIAFPLVCGISAGSSHTVNYLARQPDRAKRSFVEFGADPKIGSPATWLKGRGLFDSEYIYMHTSGPGQALPVDFVTFQANPADMRIGSFDIDAGEEAWFTKADVHTLRDLLSRVRASSSMPMLMPPVEINGRHYLDGALGPSGGIPLDAAMAAGFKRFFIVLTREREYVKGPEVPKPLASAWWRKHPAVGEALNARPATYNAMRQQIFELEKAGQALVFAPAIKPPATSNTTNVAVLQATYEAGLAQAEAEVPRWREWLSL
ncbi:MAG: patatin family protein [Propionibacteriaceae bacterium]|nr:patatin family protein [Propionibacteriaceae bacterium]